MRQSLHNIKEQHPQDAAPKWISPLRKNLYKFDGLAIAKSWANPCVTGYEIKVSRGDFLQDNKYCCYLPYCNEMYFVVPKGLIKKEEIPSEFGLIYYNTETKMLTTKKKAIYRNVEIPSDLLMYVIMNRIGSDRYPFHSSKAEYFQDWLGNKLTNKELGYHVRNRMTKAIDELEFRIKKIALQEDAVKKIDEIDDYLRDVHGVRIWDSTDRTKAIMEMLENPLPPEIKRIEDHLKSINNILIVMKERMEAKK